MTHEVFFNKQAQRVVGDINVGVIAGNCRGKKRTTTTKFGENDAPLQKRRGELKRSNTLLIDCF